jgi:hypothetical protein
VAISRLPRAPSASCVAPAASKRSSAAIVRLVGALLLEQSDEWAVQRARYMPLETIAAIGDDASLSLPMP